MSVQSLVFKRYLTVLLHHPFGFSGDCFEYLNSYNVQTNSFYNLFVLTFHVFIIKVFQQIKNVLMNH